MGPAGENTDDVRSASLMTVAQAISILSGESTATLYGAGGVAAVIAVTEGGEAVRSSLYTAPAGLGSGNRMMLSPASANVKNRGGFKPLATTLNVLNMRSKRVILPESSLTYAKRASPVRITPRGANNSDATTGVREPSAKMIFCIRDARNTVTR